VKPEAKATEGSLVAPEIAKADASRTLLSWQIRKMQGPVDTENSSKAPPSMQRSVEARGASKAQPEIEKLGAS
jgi:hypothetical protein